MRPTLLPDTIYSVTRWMLIVGWVFVVACAQRPTSTVVQCHFSERLVDIYELNPQANTVRLMSVTPPRPGVLITTDATYDLRFPENHPAPGYMELAVSINRFTSTADRATGRERMVTVGDQTVHTEVMRDTGKCQPAAGPAF